MALVLLMSAGTVTAGLNGITHPQGISDLILEPNASISSSNPVRVSVFVNDENIESVNAGVVDINNLLSDNITVMAAVINKSGRSGLYSFGSWYANSASIKSGNVKEIVTVLVFDQIPEGWKYYIVQGWFKKNATTNEQDAILWFNRTTGNLSKITYNGSFTPLAIEKGISIFTVSKIKFLQGWNKPPNPVKGATFTLYNNKKQNPHLVWTDVPSGTYRIFIHVVDKDGSNYGEYRDIDISPLPRGDLNGNGVPGDAGDLVLMKRSSIGEIPADSRYDLNNNGQLADAGDLVIMKRASIGEINL